VAPLNQELIGWERIYNTVRPHQSLGYRTPQQFVTGWRAKRKSYWTSTFPGAKPGGAC
jgi:transposase InsO family protein